MTAAIEVEAVAKRYGRVTAVDEVSLTVRPGEFLTLLGPSGCGKTTLLRLIAGFETPDRGRIRLAGEDVTRLPPQRRNVNQVFQSYALFPHLTVRENIAFGLRRQRLPEGEIAARVAEAVEWVALHGCEDRMPHELSGGQRQRVGLARAIAPRPAVLLLDEPLSALDARLRQGMQLELKRLQRRLGMTFVLVTHDQEEALTMSDRIALMNRGRIEQVGTALDLYRQPETAFAAEFIGEANLLAVAHVEPAEATVGVTLVGGLRLTVPRRAWPADGKAAKLSIRPEKVHLTRERLEDANAFAVRIEEEIFKGATDRLVLVTEQGMRLTAVVANESALQAGFAVGDRIWAAVHADDIVVLRA